MATRSQYESFFTALNTVQASGPVVKMIEALSDGIHEATPTLAYLNKFAKKDFTGAGYVSWNVIFDQRIGGSYYGADVLDTSVMEFKKPAIVPRAYYKNPVVYAYTDMVENYGPDRIQDFVADTIDLSREGMATRLTLDLYGDGTNDIAGTALGTRPFIGAALGIETNPLAGNTYAGITRGAGTKYFNNQYLQIASLNALTSDDLQNLYQRCTHMGKSPNLITLSDTAFKKIWNIAKAEKWLEPSAMAAELGFPESIKFHNSAIIPDKFLTGSAAGGYLAADVDKIYFWNIGDGMEYKVDPNDDMKMHPMVQPSNQLIYVRHITFSGQIIFKNPRLNGVLFW